MSLTKLVIVAALAGVSAHLGIFIRGEWHLVVPQIVFAHVGLLGILCMVVARHSAALGVSAVTGIEQIQIPMLLFAVYSTSLFTSIIVYRLFFHQLRNFRGPKLAAATKLWHVWKSRNSTNHLVMWELYEQYGTIVRTGPNEISIFHPNGVQLLDGVKNTNTKDVWYDILHPMTSLAFNRNTEEIRQRRVAWNQAMSIKCLNEYFSRIEHLVADLIQCVDSFDARPAKINDIMAWFAFDVMGLVTFGEDFGMIKAKEQRKELSDQRGALNMLAPVNDAVWLARLGFAFFPFLKPVQSWFRAVQFCRNVMFKRMGIKPDRVDISTFFLKEYDTLNETLGQQEAENVLMGNAINAVVAGSDTTRAGLIAMFYYICRYPEKTQKLYDEVKGVDETDLNAILSLPYLNGVIKETLRLLPPSPTVGARLTGADGLLVDDVWIPSGVKVNSTKYVIQRLPEAFKNPDEYIPERWSTQPELVLDANAYAPFSVGPRQCVGKPISLLEMRLAATVLLKRFDIRFSTKHNPDVFWRDMKDQVTFQPGDLWCEFHPREKI